ncbi:MAG: radical SAM protein [Caecibacter sp.]|nr:radical SAM protein [Caecibacter sp.]
MKKTSIIPIFIPHIGCPYRCIFCNQWRITGHHGLPGPEDIMAMIHSYTDYVSEPRHWEVAFYGGSFTAIPMELQERLLAPAARALESGKIDGIRCSTRPDAITEDIMALLYRNGLTTVELGVQSMDDDVLKEAKRGHCADDVRRATAMLRRMGFTVGHQLMPGLPGEDEASLRRTTEAICQLSPDMARIYPVVVIADTELAARYKDGTYTPLTIHEGVRRATYMKEHFLKAGIHVIRTGLQATEDLDDPSQVLAGAYTPALGELVDTQRYRHCLYAALDETKNGEVHIYYHRKDTSKVRGVRNGTYHLAGLRYPKKKFIWKEDNDLRPGTMVIDDGIRHVICVDKAWMT